MQTPGASRVIGHAGRIACRSRTSRRHSASRSTAPFVPAVWDPIPVAIRTATTEARPRYRRHFFASLRVHHDLIADGTLLQKVNMGVACAHRRHAVLAASGSLSFHGRHPECKREMPDRRLKRLALPLLRGRCVSGQHSVFEDNPALHESWTMAAHSRCVRDPAQVSAAVAHGC